MGQELICTVTAGSEHAEGKALLETSEIIFRSPTLRLKIPFASVRKLEARDGHLAITHAAGIATFAIGDKAAAWADRIRNPRSRLDKLGVKPGHRVVVLGVEDQAFRTQLAERTPDFSTRIRKDADAIFLQANSLAALDRLAKLRDAIRRDGMIWTITPKGRGGLKDIDVMAAGKSAGLVDVKVSAFNATHTATKFVIPKAQR